MAGSFVTKQFSSSFTAFGGIPQWQPKICVELHEDGRPRLPNFDLNHVSPSDARFMLKTYVEFTWSECLTLG
jgi:hypothetical protein